MSALRRFPLTAGEIEKLLEVFDNVNNGSPAKDFIDDHEVLDYLGQVVYWAADVFEIETPQQKFEAWYDKLCEAADNAGVGHLVGIMEDHMDGYRDELTPYEEVRELIENARLDGG